MASFPQLCLMPDQFLWGHMSRVCDISCFLQILMIPSVSKGFAFHIMQTCTLNFGTYEPRHVTSDQSLCKSFKYSMTVKLLTEHYLEFLSLKGGCTASSEMKIVKMPHCWKSHVGALITL